MHNDASIDPPRRQATSGAPELVVLTLYASLRATAAYVGLLADRIDMAYTAGATLDRAPADVPAAVLVRLTAASDALQEASDAALSHLDPQLARRAWAAADVASQAMPGDEHDR